MSNCKILSKQNSFFSDHLFGGGEFDDDNTSCSSSETNDQIGSGSKHKTKFIEKIAALVSQKLQPPIATNAWQNYNLNPPNVSTLGIPDATPPLKFENSLSNSKNDKFDQKRLLKFVPSSFKEKARELLKKIDENPEQLTFSSDGVIYSNKTSIPNSDVFHLFPYLFKSRHPKHLEGFEDFVNQINETGLSHLIKASVPKSTITKVQDKELSTLSTPNWWYLGP